MSEEIYTPENEAETIAIIVQYCKDNVSTAVVNLHAFYYDLGVKNNIIPVLTNDEKRSYLSKFNNDVKATRQYLLHQFIQNHF